MRTAVALSVMLLMGCASIQKTSPLYCMFTKFGEVTCRTITHESGHADWALRHPRLFSWSGMSIKRDPDGMVVGGELSHFDVLVGPGSSYRDKIDALALYFSGKAADEQLNGGASQDAQDDLQEAERVARLLFPSSHQKALQEAEEAVSVHPKTVEALARALFWSYGERLSFRESKDVFDSVK